MRGWPPWHDPSRCAYGYNVDDGSGAQLAFVSLFNDSNQYHLAVIDFGLDPASGSAIDALVVDQAKIGTTGVQGSPVITGRGPMAGFVTSGEVAAHPVSNFTPNFNSGSMGIRRNSPMLVLSPGWSLTAYSSTDAAKLGVTFFWAIVLPDELLFNKIGDPDIDP